VSGVVVTSGVVAAVGDSETAVDASGDSGATPSSPKSARVQSGSAGSLRDDMVDAAGMQLAA